MTRSRRGVYIPIPSPRHGASTPRTLSADYAARVCRGSVTEDGVTPVPPSSVDTSFYGDLSTPEIHAELVRLGQIMQNGGLLA